MSVDATCNECSANLADGMTHCWMCGARVEVVLDAFVLPDPDAPTPPVAQQRARFQFSLASLMLTVTLVAVVAGVFHQAPGLGALLLIFGIPAYVLTCETARNRRTGGRPMSSTEKAGVFVSSSVQVLAIVVATALVLVIVGVVAVIFLMVVCAPLIGGTPGGG